MLFAQEFDSSSVTSCTVCSPSALTVPRMPLALDPLARHGENIGLSCCVDNLCVARPVGKAEIDRTPAAKASMQKERDRLRSKAVWDEQHQR